MVNSKQISEAVSDSMARFLCGLLLTVAVVAAAAQQKPLSLQKRPNIVFILTDDQDIELGSLEYMPLVQKYLINEGTFFKRHYCTTAICCPSRVTLWTGKNAHNTNVTDVFPPYGQFPSRSLGRLKLVEHLEH